MNLARRRRKLRQFALADKDFFFAGRDIDIPKLAVLAEIVALYERNLGTVRTPLNRLRSPARNAAFRENLFNGEFLWSGGLSTCHERKDQKVHGEYEKYLLHE